jgi:predicted Zn finger-like uncharacterized protein
MALISCASCHSDADIHLESVAADGARTLRCGTCGHTWSAVNGSHAPVFTRTPFEMARGRFATPKMVDPALNARVTRLRSQFLKTGALPDPAVAEHFARCRELYSVEGLATAYPQQLRDAVTNPLGGNIGNLSVFSRAWKRLGEEDAADRIRASIDHLLRGPDAVPLEDRLTRLVDDPDGTGMPGLKEAALTKVLCVMEPDRFLPALTYGTPDTGKRDLTEAVYGLHLPKVDATSMQIGRLAVWSNDLLLELAGQDFAGPQHVAEFLWWAKDRVKHTAMASVR